MEDSQPESDLFSVRIVSIDYYMSPPITDLDTCYSSFQGGKVNEVPVIRIYGSTPAGQKTCLHVHRVLPYLYVPCSDLIHTSEEGDRYTLNISNAIEKALKSKLKSSSGFKRQHVHGCSLVRAKKFYGFHSSEELFVKIYLYYPHEVSRVATLLLDGAVQDRSYQPHESHIPYLLQFLVDYNLYGMGHLHLSKVKFRYPLPDGFFPRAAHQSGVSKCASGEVACRSASDQADSSIHSWLGSPVWISATVRSDWKWPPTDSSPDQEACLTKRQSTCQLEGDSTVDDIVNQQSKVYSSLSQTRSDMKMVQSLVPIWQEEYERTGTHEEVVHSEHSKPLPENVLKTFSHGPECEMAFMNLCGEAQHSSASQLTPSKDADHFLQSIGSLADVSSMCEKGEANLNCSSGSASSSSKQDVDAVPSELRHISSEIVPVNEEMESSEETHHTYPKGIDAEALGLLRWLASSQAEGELNTDDELGCDLMLTPLFPKPEIDKILEKANLDYECESQQECQDILDSIGDTNSYNLKSQVVKSTTDNLLTQIPSKSKIPQLDGSFDDLVAGCAGNASEVDLNIETKGPSHQKSQGIEKRLTKKKKKRSQLWGSLPFSTQQKADGEPESSFKSIDASNETIDCTISSSSGKKDSESYDDSVSDADMNVSGEMEQKLSTASSTRDLMRRKRFRRVEPAEATASIVEKVHLDERHGTPISSGPLEFHVKENDVEDVIQSKTSAKPWVADQATIAYERHPALVKHAQRVCLKDPGFGPSCCDTPMYGKLPLMPCIDRALKSSSSKNPYSTQPDHFQSFGISSTPQSKALIDVPLFSSGTEELSKPLMSTAQEATVGFGLSECCVLDKAELSAGRLTKLDETGQEGYTTDSCRPDMYSDTYGDTGAATDADVLETGDFSLQQGIQTYPPCPSPSTTHSTCVEMSFSKKPPAAVWRNCKPDDTSDAPVVPNQSFTMNKENSEGMLGCSTNSMHYERSDAVELPPFFSNKDEDMGKVYKSDRNNDGQETVLGIPTHYKNDGTLLYLLTTIYSPPSVDFVNEWLMRHPRRQAPAGMVRHPRRQAPAVGSIHFELLDPPPSNSSIDFSRQNIITDEETTSNHTILTHGNDTMDSQEILVDVDPETLPECRPVPHVESRDEFTLKSPRKLHTESTVLKANAHVENFQNVSQLSAPDARLKLTPLSQTGFRDPASVGDGQQLTLMSIEVHAASRGDLRPDPRFDAITVIAITIQEDNVPCLETTVLLHDNTWEPSQRSLDGISGCTVIATSEEKHLLYHFMKIVRISDPDILMGWEIQGGSLGFLAERAAHLGVILLDNLSRTPSCETKVLDPNSASHEIGLPDLLAEALISDPTGSQDALINDEWGRTHASGVHVGGRIVLNVWRLMRGEIKLNMYSIEAVAEEVLRRRVPLIPPRILTQWFSSGPGQARYRCLEYIIARAKLNLEIMNQLDIINRTSELARVFGIDFFSVLSRGSQYRVESMLFRLAHTQNYLAISPGNQQVASQPAMECLPLVMEPESHFYADPVVVLDFQSLYPSMIIAYNLCFSTCLGKVLPAKENTLGVSSYLPDTQLLMDLKDKILLTPNGVMYVPSEVRKGVLPRLLDEILSTRIMVKRAMKKLTPSQQVLHRIFNARQLALKLISNVTYGYTAAGFSGRMPCAELADSIVQCGRRTLESAISFVNSHEQWNARVVYGDTDSMFVLLKGRSVEESFSIGQEIASAITSMNPDPVTLKMEKVYHPCFLLTKKRYVGFSYETPDQTEPLFDAKGIETVRRDSCGAVAKTLEQSLKLFFKHQDISKVKLYLQRQWTRILGGRVSLQDFVFAKEVRLGTYSTRSTSLPPSAIVATKAMKVDPRAEPRYAERIPYVVVHGEPGARLVDMVVDPLELLAIESPFRLNDSYYINKQIIPALQRVFGLVGADLRQWFLEMPRPVRPSVGKRFSNAPNGQRTRIDCYYISRHCFLCGELVQASSHFCDKCSMKESAVAVAVSGRTSKLERDIQHLAAICRHCGGGDWIIESGVKCVSLACSVFYERLKVQKELQALSAVATDMGFYPKCSVEWF